jgi:phosphoglycolate phosphatase-like HAD superfamily hydrolase
MLDLDGTVVDSEERFYAAYVGALEAAARESVSCEEFRARSRSGVLLTALGLPVSEGITFWGDLMRRFVTDQRSRLLPGADDALRLLRARGTTTALVTGRLQPVASVEAELADLGLAGAFDFVATAETLQMVEGARQTKSELFHAVERVLGLPADKMVYVTDWPPDLLDAHAHGVEWCFGVETGGFAGSDFPVRDRVATSPSLRRLVIELEVAERAAASGAHPPSDR